MNQIRLTGYAAADHSVQPLRLLDLGCVCVPTRAVQRDGAAGYVALGSNGGFISRRASARW